MWRLFDYGQSSGEVTEWLIVQHWKCCVRLKPYRGFESPPLRSNRDACRNSAGVLHLERIEWIGTHNWVRTVPIPPNGASSRSFGLAAQERSCSARCGTYRLDFTSARRPLGTMPRRQSSGSSSAAPEFRDRVDDRLFFPLAWWARTHSSTVRLPLALRIGRRLVICLPEVRELAHLPSGLIRLHVVVVPHHLAVPVTEPGHQHLLRHPVVG
jgi:hypothetical protein